MNRCQKILRIIEEYKRMPIGTPAHLYFAEIAEIAEGQTDPLTLNQYQELASRTLPAWGVNHFFILPAGSSGAAEFARNVDLLHGLLGLIGELGELIDPIKRAMFYGKPLGEEQIVNIKEEAGDSLWYIAGPICRALGCTMEDLAGPNIDKLKLRYPGKYTDAAALARADKVPSEAAPHANTSASFCAGGES